MAEEFYQPKMFPKFIQIAFKPNDSNLYALDENGDVYRRDMTGSHIVWIRQTGREETP
jgi:hypothetical protein